MILVIQDDFFQVLVRGCKKASGQDVFRLILFHVISSPPCWLCQPIGRNIEMSLKISLTVEFPHSALALSRSP
jgi:hypothetical protein